MFFWNLTIKSTRNYTETNISITGNISVIRANQGNGRIIGAIWGR